MEKAIIGAGGFAREVKAAMKTPNIKFFVDDKYENTKSGIFRLSQFDPEQYEVIVAVGDPTDRKNIVSRLPKNTKFFTFIDSSAIIMSDVEIGIGSIICAGTIITTNVKIGNHAHLNLQTTIGHDTIIGDYFTTAPGAKISGNCNIGNLVYVGTNASIKEKLNICDNIIVGLGSGVVKNINESGVYVGLPSVKK